MSPTLGSAEPTPEMLQTRPLHAGGLITGVGATLPAGSVIVTVWVTGALGDAPLVGHRQRHRVGVREVYVRVGSGPLPVPLPKFQA